MLRVFGIRLGMQSGCLEEEGGSDQEVQVLKTFPTVQFPLRFITLQPTIKYGTLEPLK